MQNDPYAPLDANDRTQDGAPTFGEASVSQTPTGEGHFYGEAPAHLMADSSMSEVEMAADMPVAPAEPNSSSPILEHPDATDNASDSALEPSGVGEVWTSTSPIGSPTPSDGDLGESATPQGGVFNEEPPVQREVVSGIFESEASGEAGGKSASFGEITLFDRAVTGAGEDATREDALREDAETTPPPLPAVNTPAPPRPLVAGAFLRGEFEIREVVSRGMTNLYHAIGGDYGANEPKLIAERDLPDTRENVAEPSSVGENPGGDELASPAADFYESGLVPEYETFIQDDREYRVFEWVDTVSLQDWREPTSDERLLALLHPLAHFLTEIEARGEWADISTETLRIRPDGALHFFGFTNPRIEGGGGGGEIPTPLVLESLRSVTQYLLKHVFAESGTMRLDSPYAGLALSDEVKEWANRLDGPSVYGDRSEESGGEAEADFFTGIAQATAALDAIYRPGRLIADCALLSDVGQERELNEDAGLIVRSQRAAHLGARDLELYVVSDGMGGHEGGEVASDLTLSSLQQHLSDLTIDWNDNVAVRAALYDVINAVNADVVALTETPKYRASRSKPGATLVFAVRQGARIWVGNVGDSRAYRWNENGLQRISRDHSYVQNLVDRGELSEDDAWGHPDGSIITAHIGYPKLKTRDVFLRLFKPGDTLLLVSDGVIDMLRDREIEPLVRDGDAQTVVRALVDASNAAGGYDNITAICVRFS